MEKYGLIGYPLRHSFSIGYFNEKFKSEGINAEYVNFEIPSINNFMEVIEENPNLCGLNVTIPYKEQVIPFLDELDRDTAKIGAVNVIKIIRQPKGKVKLVGYNSDIIGFTQSIQPLLQPHHKKALILGTGGASKAVYHGLKNLGIESIFASKLNFALAAMDVGGARTMLVLITLAISTWLNTLYFLRTVITLYRKPVPGAVYSVARGQRGFCFNASLVAFSIVNVALGLFAQTFVSAITAGLATFG